MTNYWIVAHVTAALACPAALPSPAALPCPESSVLFIECICAKAKHACSQPVAPCQMHGQWHASYLQCSAMQIP